MALTNVLIPRHVQTAQAACEAMFSLNRYVKRDETYLFQVYALKQRLVKVLYQQGYCVVVFRDSGALCFVFEVGAGRYVWHQPQVSFEVAVSAWQPILSRPVEGAEIADAGEAMKLRGVVERWIEAVSR